MARSNVYINGKIVPAAEACVSVADTGLLHGVSAWAAMYAQGGRIFRAESHLDRLMETVSFLGIRTEADADELAAQAHELLGVNELTEASVRVTLTPGDPAAARPTTLISADPMPDYPRHWYERGIMVVISSLKQVPGDVTTGIQSGCYLPRILARQEAAAKTGEEALWFTPDGRLAEACFGNVFVVSEGKVRTPPRDTPVVPGITRQAVLELCDELGIPRDEEQSLTVNDMLSAGEIFLTSSCPGIRPVARVERHVVGEGAPGPVTRRLMKAYRELLDRECGESLQRKDAS